MKLIQLFFELLAKYQNFKYELHCKKTVMNFEIENRLLEQRFKIEQIKRDDCSIVRYLPSIRDLVIDIKTRILDEHPNFDFIGWKFEFHGEEFWIGKTEEDYLKKETCSIFVGFIDPLNLKSYRDDVEEISKRIIEQEIKNQ